MDKGGHKFGGWVGGDEEFHCLTRRWQQLTKSRRMKWIHLLPREKQESSRKFVFPIRLIMYHKYTKNPKQKFRHVLCLPTKWDFKKYIETWYHSFLQCQAHCKPPVKEAFIPCWLWAKVPSPEQAHPQQVALHRQMKHKLKPCTLHSQCS